MVLIIAHRGGSAIEPENSLAAFRRAFEVGADGVELDVHTTADGELVVIHDADLAGRPVCNLQSAFVLQHRLRNGEPLPTLRAALDVITPGGLAFIELKALPPEADQRLLALIDACPAPDRCRVHAFDHALIRRLTARRPTLQAGILSDSYAVKPAIDVTNAGAVALWQRADLVDAPLAALVREAGYALYAWTVDRSERMRRLVADGVDGICTNRPDLAREVIG
jgi:glycerophosphoryl diester phosphodiesterase